MKEIKPIKEIVSKTFYLNRGSLNEPKVVRVEVAGKSVPFRQEGNSIFLSKETMTPT